MYENEDARSNCCLPFLGIAFQLHRQAERIIRIHPGGDGPAVLTRACRERFFLKTSDAAGTSSVTGSTNWSNGAVPSSGNTYFTTNTSGVGLQMRGLLNRY
jgi:hypothetical protein